MLTIQTLKAGEICKYLDLSEGEEGTARRALLTLVTCTLDTDDGCESQRTRSVAPQHGLTTLLLLVGGGASKPFELYPSTDGWLKTDSRAHNRVPAGSLLERVWTGQNTNT